MGKAKVKREGIIVGVDPGATTGLAILTLDSDPLLVTSIRNATRDILIKKILDWGEPVLFASDVTPVPESIVKLASLFDAPLYQPKKSLSQQEKREIVQEFQILKGMKSLDDHSKDALAAVLKAFKRYKNKFEKIEVKMKGNTLTTFQNELKAALIQGVSLKKALETTLKKHRPTRSGYKIEILPKKEYLKKENIALKEKLRDKELVIEQLQRENERLTGKVQELQDKNSQLHLNLEKAREEDASMARKERIYWNQRREITRLKEKLKSTEQRVDSLVQRIKRIKDLRRSGRYGDFILLKTIRSFTRKGIEEAVVRMDIKEGDPLFIYNASGGGPSTAKMLAGLCPSFIISKTKMSHQAEEILQSRGIKVIDSKSICIYEVEGIPSVNSHDLKLK